MASHAEFRSAYERTLPAIDALEQLPHNEAHVEACIDVLRQGLASMEQSTSKMMNMLYEVDVYMTPSSVQNAAGFNPQEALTHVSDLFHVGSACRHSHIRRVIKQNFWPSERHWRTIRAKTYLYQNLPHNGARLKLYNKDSSKAWMTWLTCWPSLAKIFSTQMSIKPRASIYTEQPVPRSHQTEDWYPQDHLHAQGGTAHPIQVHACRDPPSEQCLQYSSHLH